MTTSTSTTSPTALETPALPTDAPSVGAPPIDAQLTRAERATVTAKLLAQAHATTDADKRKALLDGVILLNRCVAEAVARRYRHRGVPDDDVDQAAYEGLVKAVQRFDPSVRPDLLTYAVPTIRGEIQRYFRDQGWMVRPPRRIQELQWRISRSVEELSQSLGRPPDQSEIGQDLGSEETEIAEALGAFGAFTPPSLDQPVVGTEGLTLGDSLPDDDERELEAAEARTILGPAVRTLSERDRQLLDLRFFEQLSQSEIGARLGISQVQVSRLLSRIYRDLRAAIAA